MEDQDTLGKLRRQGHALFGWCSACGSPSRYWDDVKARRAPRRAKFDVDLDALVSERGDRSPVLDMGAHTAPALRVHPHTETRVTAPAKPAGTP
ncbi:MAG TPA: hypothetical protein VGU20_00705 [Stellaceae bacterium]|nr:hypothetical protein [Stellaceae bacterium]